MPASAGEISAAARRWMAVLLVVISLIVAAYWLSWLLHRSLVAVETSKGYVQFEDAFPLADGILVVCLLASAFSLLTGRGAALFWLLVGGGAGLYLFAMDDLYDLQHGIWGKGTNGIIELIINLVTLVLSLFVLWWTWSHREGLRPA